MQSIKSKEQIDNLINNSDTSPIIFFKHSLSCPISARAYHKVSEALEQNIVDENLIYIVIVPDQRDLSDYVAEKTGIIHESPQIILIRDRQVAYYASHGVINIDEMIKFLNN